MKKIIVACGILFLAFVGGTSAQEDEVTGADCAPPETIFFFSLPDSARTAARWASTDLSRLMAEPEVRAFMERPLSRLPSLPGFPELLARAGELEPRDLFIALTSLGGRHDQPHVLAGFEFKGDRAAVEGLLAQLKALVAGILPDGRTEEAQYQGHAIDLFRAGAGGEVLAGTFVGNRYLFANDPALLRAALDRLDARDYFADEWLPALSADPDFLGAATPLPKDGEMLIFCRPRPLHDQLVLHGAPPLPPSLQGGLEKVRALAGTTAFANGKMRDTIFCLGTGFTAEVTPLDLSALPMTSSANTVAYAVTRLQFAQTFGLVGPDDLAAVLGGVTLASLHAAFGEDLAAQLDLSPRKSRLAPLFTVPIRDNAAVVKIGENLDELGDAGWTKFSRPASNAGTLDGYRLQLSDGPIQSLVVSFHENRLLLAPTPSDLERALAASAMDGKGQSLARSETYQRALSLVGHPDYGFIYLDLQGLFERLYAKLKPVAELGALLYPQAGEYFEADKLPEAASISDHLSPIVLSVRRVPQGILAESEGPITLPQLLLGAAMGWAGSGHQARRQATAALGFPAQVSKREGPDQLTRTPNGTPR